MQNVRSSAHHGTYVVTYDVASRLQSFRTGTLKVPYQNDPLFKSFHSHLLKKMQRALPHVTIHTITMDAIRRKIWKQVDRRIQNKQTQVALSTCSEIADSNLKSEGLVLNINRLFNTDGEIIGHGPRPRFEALDKQLDTLVAQIAGRSIVLTEDGAFTGGTLRYVLKNLNERGLKVTAIVIGFCCTMGLTVLQEVFDGELVIVDPLENLIDWIPDHDLIPFIPNCGRVLGERVSESFAPVRTLDGVSCAYPYILPFGKMGEWATLPPEGVRDISKLCLDTSIKLFSHIKGHRGHKITIGELMQINPRVSMPIGIGSHKDIPPFDTEVVGFLEQMRRILE